jgi:hypothetical protein
MIRTFKKTGRHGPALLLFAFLSLGMTYPLALHLGDRVPSDLGDPLYTVWVLAWDFHKLGDGLAGLWDANIFYPHHGTLLYADSLLGLAFLAAPFLALGVSLVSAYNILFLLSFFLAGLSMYCLVIHLTKSRAAAVLAGLVFAFFPYRFAHISHLELLYMAWMPFCLLFLHKFFERPSYKNLFAATAFFIFQAMSCAYYGVHLAVVVALFIIFFGWRTRLIVRASFWAKMGLLAVCSLVVLGPLFYPYVRVHRQMLFVRSLTIIKSYSAQLQHFLAVPPWNAIWGGLTSSLGAQEWQLYPGIIPILLAAALFVLRPKSTPTTAGGIPGPLRLSDKFSLQFYGSMALFAFLLSLGPAIQIFNKVILPGPYKLLYSWVPGFQGLRVPSRLSVMMMLGLAVLSGFGAARWIERTKSSWGKTAVPLILGGLLLTDFLSVPIPLARLESPGRIPAVYSAVRDLPQGASLIELPIPQRGQAKSREALYMYYSAYHWKKLVNGYSGYIPPGYTIIGEAMQNFPSGPTFELLRDLEVGYLLVHTEWFMGTEGKKVKAGLDAYPGEVELLSASDGDFLFRLVARPGQGKTTSPLPEVGDKRTWTASSNCANGQARLAFDGNSETGWSTGRPQTEGDYFWLDLGESLRLGEVDLSLNKRPLDYPRGYRLEGSDGGREWKILSEDPFYFPELTVGMIEDFSKYRMEIVFEPCRVRFLRLTLTLEHKSRAWSIQEIVCRGEKTKR